MSDLYEIIIMAGVNLVSLSLWIISDKIINIQNTVEELKKDIDELKKRLTKPGEKL